MAKIIYGIAGEGSGHSMRARVILEHLKKKGHKIKIFSHDRGYDNLKDDFDCTDIFGLRFVYEKNKVRYLKTFMKNLNELGPAGKSLGLINKTIREFKPDFVFSDFEPLTGLAARLNNVPLLSIDNQHRITNFSLHMPVGFTKDIYTAKAVINLINPGAKAYLVTSFFESKVKRKNTHIVPPVIRDVIYDLKPKKGNYILVYVTSKFDGIVKVLKQMDEKFIVYGLEKDERDGNITYKMPSKDGFLHDLANCKAVISTAGFTLLSETLYLKKPFCAIPIKGQFEQIINAFYLQKLGYGKFVRKLTKKQLENFLESMPKYEARLEKYNKADRNKMLLRKVDWFVGKFSKESEKAKKQKSKN
jgi:uncharacterized protein (TIGR00661 family)